MTQAGTRPTSRTRPPLVRPTQGRVVGGVCMGVSQHLGVPLGILRALTLVACFVGAGLPAYGFLWLTMPRSDAPPVVESFTGRPHISGRHLLIAGAVVVAVAVASAMQAVGSHWSVGSAIPLLAIVGGAIIVWSRLDQGERRQWISRDVGENQRSLIRLAVGLVLVVGGIILLVSQGRGFAGLRDVAVAAVVVLFGAVLIAAPFIARLWESLKQEEAGRIRATEKADIAAHLHDSVLQTLALIQRRSGDAQAVQLLARAQERELREWLYAQDNQRDATLAALVSATVHEVEELHGVPIDLVVSGDRPVDDGGQALVGSLREAAANAVRHGAPPVSVYFEVGATAVEAFVRDHGEGFDLDEVPGDRLGVRESILGRMRRHGGDAVVRRREDGTEVSLRLPISKEESHE
nr:PspC domain-containing protein [Leekyejoonella antrihumi]